MKKQNLFLKEAYTIALTPRERHALRERILSYMEYHPLRMPIPKKRAQFFKHCGVYVGALLRSRATLFRVAAGACAVVLLLAVPFAAEQALPGDTLYLIKVRVNEGVRARLLSLPYEKLQWETERIERRIAEARLLVKEGKLTKEKEDALEETIRSHASAFQEQLAQMRKGDGADVAVAEVTLESALDVQSAVLDFEIGQAASSGSANEGDVKELVAIVREARADVVSATSRDTTVVSYAPLVARVEENTTRMHVLLDDIANELTEEQKSEIQKRIDTIDAVIATAQKAHEAASNEEATPLLREVLATTEKLIAFMSDIELRSSVALDALVPAGPEETQKSDLEKTLESLTLKYTALITVAEGLEDLEVAAYLAQLQVFDLLLKNAKNDLTFENIAGAQEKIMQAEALIAELEERT